ncbi:uncharacterized protein LOC113279436 [Papaver somniferum]|uniref:uncharacterized protein LOC113279436 n=1 Tax=Papaver somniferum TaxID=3469 RepID=UPI000E6FBF07|nr:uncharacterized protein LOC113279436 [Papaver somniferum]
MVVKSHYKNIINECRENMVELNGRLKMLEEKTSICVYFQNGSHLKKASPNSGNASNNHVSTSLVRDNGSSLRITNVVQQPVGVSGKIRSCKLLIWYVEGEIVVEAVIADNDPKKLIHGMPMGFGAYKVSVTASLVDDALLYRQTNELKYIQDALGTYISWAKDLILLD